MAVPQQKLHGSWVHCVDSLCNINDVQLIVPPQQIVFTKISVDQQTVLVHCLHVLCTSQQLLTMIATAVIKYVIVRQHFTTTILQLSGFCLGLLCKLVTER